MATKTTDLRRETLERSTLLGKVYHPKGGRRRYVVAVVHWVDVGGSNEFHLYDLFALSGADRGSHGSGYSPELSESWELDKDQTISFSGKRAHARESTYRHYALRDEVDGGEGKTHFYFGYEAVRGELEATSGESPSESSPEPSSLEDLFGEPISSYTREQALEDGGLVDVSEWASPREILNGGFSIPVAVTHSVWAAIENIPVSLEGINDVRGRAHDVLYLAFLAARRARGESRVGFKVILPRKGTRKRNAFLYVDIGPGDSGEPVVTIGFPEDF